MDQEPIWKRILNNPKFWFALWAIVNAINIEAGGWIPDSIMAKLNELVAVIIGLVWASNVKSVRTAVAKLLGR